MENKNSTPSVADQTDAPAPQGSGDHGVLGGTSFYQALEQRLGREKLGQRLEQQVHHAADVYGGRGRMRLHPENMEPLMATLDVGLRVLRLTDLGRRNAADYRLERIEHRLPGLAGEFDGFTILQLSDIHADRLADTSGRLEALLTETPCDLAVLTGDYRFDTHGDYGPCLRRMGSIVAALRSSHGVLGILGNHDFVETVPLLEELGIQLLLNESWPLERVGKRLFIAGVDDPHYYAGDDLDRALAGKDDADTVVLLSHSPELYREALAAGVHLYLCGHTHGGQICLPGGFAPLVNAACPRRLTRGSWDYNGMRGYTSRGTGASGLPVRFFCPPEVTLHTLRCLL